MSLQTGKSYVNAEGAVFVVREASHEVYEGEITDAKGTRRHILGAGDEGDWKEPAPTVEAAEAAVAAVPEVESPAQIVVQQIADAEELKSAPIVSGGRKRK